MEEAMEKFAIAIATSSRLNREDYRHTEHDSAFTNWKVLIGPSDWEDHSNGKEGADRYRTQNLPNCTSCTGVYELGIAVWSNKTGRESGKVNPDFTIPVYLGKSDNIRNRLQQYGRYGAHLENGSFNAKLNDCCKILAQTGYGLFRDIFSKGFSIVYRWAPMKSTRDAEKTESDLLDKYDYAWNRGSNGPRRPHDILKKLLYEKKKGIKIKAYEISYLEKGLNFYPNLETNGLLHEIFKFGRSQPRLVVRSVINENYAGICGVALGHGVICKRAPNEGNKRCSEHKGMKEKGFNSKLLTDGKSTLVANDYPIDENLAPACGVILDDGSCCTSKPVQGNKICLEHKGSKICNSTPQLMKDKEERYVHGPILDCNTLSKGGKQYIHKDAICGVDLDDGTFCTRQPPAGRNRCEEHKGMKIKESTCISRREETPSFFENSGSKSGREKSQNHYLNPSVFCDKIPPTCGAATQDGSSCSRKPAEGNKRWQHKDTRDNASPGCSSCNDLRRTNATFGYASYSPVCECFSSSNCGATLQNGSLCGRKPTEGNKRCWQHKGMRADSSPAQNQYLIPSVSCDKISPTCGAATQDGTSCSRKPVEGNKRCWQHKGMRVNASPGSSSCNDLRRTNATSGYASYGSVYEYFSSSNCGATLQNGSSCSRKPTEGNKRCWQHKGMRADSSPASSNNSRYYANSYCYATSSTCGAPTRNGSYCRRSTGGGRCWQHGG